MVSLAELLELESVEELVEAFVTVVLLPLVTEASRACRSDESLVLLAVSVEEPDSKELRLPLTLSDEDEPPPNSEATSLDSTLSISICVSCPGVAVFNC